MSVATKGDRLAVLDQYPNGSTLPVEWVRQLASDLLADRVSLAVERKLTVDMWVEIARRSMSAVPEEAWDDSGVIPPESKE